MPRDHRPRGTLDIPMWADFRDLLLAPREQFTQDAPRNPDYLTVPDDNAELETARHVVEQTLDRFRGFTA